MNQEKRRKVRKSIYTGLAVAIPLAKELPKFRKGLSPQQYGELGSKVAIQISRAMPYKRIAHDADDHAVFLYNQGVGKKEIAKKITGRVGWGLFRHEVSKNVARKISAVANKNVDPSTRPYTHMFNSSLLGLLAYQGTYHTLDKTRVRIKRAMKRGEK